MRMRSAITMLCAFGCAGKDDPLPDAGYVGPVDAGLSGVVDAGPAASAWDASYVAPSVPLPPTTPTGPMGAEVCDGFDNDGNGVSDDVDVGKDGICDCLVIGTIGGGGVAGTDNVFASWLSARGSQPAEAIGQITPESIAKFQVIVIKDVANTYRLSSQAEIDALAAWVNAGGGLMAMSGYGLDGNIAVNLLLRPYGVTFNGDSVLFNPGFDALPVTEWVHPHPVTDEISQVGINLGSTVAGDGQVLAREQGSNLMSAKEFGMGRVLLWGDEWITYSDQWTNRKDYQVERLWQNSIKWLTNPRQCQVEIPPLL